VNLDQLVQRCSVSPDERWDVCSELYSALLSSGAEAVDLAPYAASFASFWRDVDEHVRPFQRKSGNSWRWEEDYQDPRNEASLLLDILGYVPGDEIRSELHRALTLSDPSLVMVAALSLLRQSETVNPAALDFVAGSDETRNQWQRSLGEAGYGYLFSPEFADAESRARGCLVEWLIHPTEWECAPDDVERMAAVGEIYVFQFRTRLGYHWSSAHGWVAGIGGADFGFSDYRPSALANPEEHARRMLGMMSQ
jgi:hypothetical protein